MKVGIIGTGTMGIPMARNILKAGDALIIYARHPEKVEGLKQGKSKIVNSPAEVGVESEIILLSLPFDPDVEEIVLGENGVLSGAAPGSIILDTTTGTPEASVQMAALCAEKEVGYLDAPISGGVKRAEEAKLTFIVGGEDNIFDKALPLMKKLGENIYKVGPVGAGRTLKALNQIIAGMNTLILCETLALGQKAGISPETFYEVLSKCAANSFHLQTKLPNFIIPGNFDGGHRIEMMIKDLEIALQVAKAHKTPIMLTGIGTQLYRAGAGSGYSDKDISSMVNFFGSFAELDTDNKKTT